MDPFSSGKVICSARDADETPKRTDAIKANLHWMIVMYGIPFSCSDGCLAASPDDLAGGEIVTREITSAARCSALHDAQAVTLGAPWLDPTQE